jgi:hypothetical protein
MKKPEITSFTKVCAPNPIAKPPTPAVASAGAMSIPVARRIIMTATVTMRIPAVVFSMPIRVSARLMRSTGAAEPTIIL